MDRDIDVRSDDANNDAHTSSVFSLISSNRAHENINIDKKDTLSIPKPRPQVPLII
jgi:hypothetical protein